MDSRVDSVQRDDGLREPVRAAHEASAAGPLAQRVSELETLLAVERAESARRLKEMDALMRQTRSALHELQGDFRRTVSERDELREQVAQRDTDVRELEQRVRVLRAKAERATTEREGATAEVVAAAIARAQRSEVELARARQTMVKLHERVRLLEDGGSVENRAAEERIATLERNLALRESELIRAAEKLAELDPGTATLAAQRVRGTLPPAAVVDDACDTNDDPAAAGAIAAQSVGSSTYIPVDAEVVVSSRAISSAESGTYLPVVPAEPSPSTATDGVAAPTPGSQPRMAPPERRIVVTQTRSPRKRPPASLPMLEGLSIEREVSRDSDGVLLHARDDATDRAVAVRVLPRGTVRPSSASVSRLLAVQHHNVAAVLRCDLGPDGPYIVSERPPGERVDAWIRRVGPVGERIALAVLLQVARALREGAAHEVHHGDLSPTCLWTDAAGVVRVSALGLQELIPHRDGRAHAAFLAPELRKGETPDARSDMFALGVCLRFLLGGPAVAQEPERLTALRPRVAREVVELAGTLAAADCDERPESWDDVVRLIQTVLQACAQRSAAAPDGIVGTLVHRPHVLVGLLAAIVVVVAAWVQLMPGDEASVREAFNAAVVRAEQMEAQGNVEGARRIYLEFTSGTGDTDIELDAARRLDALRE